MATYLRTIVTMPHDSGLPADAVQNTFAWHALGAVDLATAASEINARLDAFYTAISQYISSQYNPSALVVKHYDMSESRPRFPFSESTVDAGAGQTASNDLPAEVALCVSYEGPRQSGLNQRRRRGRIFIGPLQEGSGDYALAGATIQDVVADAAEANLLGSSGGPYLLKWAVYSRLQHFGIPVGGSIGELDEDSPERLPVSFTDVSKMWVDNAWDTQRRRGVKATNRTVRNAPS